MVVQKPRTPTPPTGWLYGMRITDRGRVQAARLAPHPVRGRALQTGGSGFSLWQRLSRDEKLLGTLGMEDQAALLLTGPHSAPSPTRRLGLASGGWLSQAET